MVAVDRQAVCHVFKVFDIDNLWALRQSAKARHPASSQLTDRGFAGIASSSPSSAIIVGPDMLVHKVCFDICQDYWSNTEQCGMVKPITIGGGLKEATGWLATLLGKCEESPTE